MKYRREIKATTKNYQLQRLLVRVIYVYIYIYTYVMTGGPTKDEIRRSVVDCGAFGRNGINKRDA